MANREKKRELYRSIEIIVNGRESVSQSMRNGKRRVIEKFRFQKWEHMLDRCLKIGLSHQLSVSPVPYFLPTTVAWLA